MRRIIWHCRGTSCLHADRRRSIESCGALDQQFHTRSDVILLSRHSTQPTVHEANSTFTPEVARPHRFLQINSLIWATDWNHTSCRRGSQFVYLFFISCFTFSARNITVYIKNLLEWLKRAVWRTVRRLPRLPFCIFYYSLSWNLNSGWMNEKNKNSIS